MIVRQISAISLFLLKTIFFSPSGNPSFWIILLIGSIFYIGGDLGKHEVVLLLLFIGISHRLMPAINKYVSPRNFVSSSTLSNYTQLLPVDNNIFFSAFMLCSIIYAISLMSLCIYVGTILEKPPVIESLCPPQIVSVNTTTKVPLLTVEGLLMERTVRSVSGPYHYKVPLHYSLFFSMLASDVLIDYHKIPDNTFKKLYHVPDKEHSNPEISFSNLNNISQSKYYSTFLYDLNSIHFQRLLITAWLIFLFFIIDTLRRYRGNENKFINIFKSIDFVFYTIYVLICLLLFLDILLPESVIRQYSMIVAKYKIPISIFPLFVTIAALIRILFTILPQRNHK